MLNSDDDTYVSPVGMDGMENVDERTMMPVASEQAKAILGLEEEGWPHRQGDVMALISCE